MEEKLKMTISQMAVRAFIAVSAVSLGTTSLFARAEQGAYLSSEDVDLSVLLAPPPAPQSADQQRDLAEVLRVQRERTPQEVAAGIADLDESVFRFGDVLGPRFKDENLPKTARLFKAANLDAEMIASNAKTHFRRARPFVVSSEVHPTVPTKQKAYYRAYPSGHATMGYLDAILLASMVPEKRAELFARGRQYGENRIVDGVHYPTDTEAGRLDGTVVAAALMRNPKFNADMTAARDELRAALGLQ
ncbi:MAG: acid phosphatase [Caballeronia mineralivorans]|jgi:acid phosphatase (class A)|nr:acid phosphatase [Caballeronia mineralivorans]